MKFIYRKAGGTDPLGDQLFVGTDTKSTSLDQAMGRALVIAERWNKGKFKDRHVATIQCDGHLLVDVKTLKCRSLTEATPPPLTPQPDLDLTDRKEPRLL